MSTTPKPFTTGEIRLAVQLYGEGQTAYAVAQTLGRSEAGVIRHLRGAGVTMRPQGWAGARAVAAICAGSGGGS